MQKATTTVSLRRNQKDSKLYHILIWLHVSAVVKWHNFSKINEAGLICNLSAEWKYTSSHQLGDQAAPAKACPCFQPFTVSRFASSYVHSKKDGNSFMSRRPELFHMERCMEVLCGRYLLQKDLHA